MSIKIPFSLLEWRGSSNYQVICIEEKIILDSLKWFQIEKKINLFNCLKNYQQLTTLFKKTQSNESYFRKSFCFFA